MTSKADFKKSWENETPADRRARLDELGAMVMKSDEELREHDALAEMVAEDEDLAAKEQAAE